MRFIAALDTSIYGVPYLQGALVDTTGWTRKMMLQFLDNGIIAPADISKEMLSQVTLDEIGDVDATDPPDGYTLRWDAATQTWVAGPASDTHVLDDLEDVDLQYELPETGDVLTYDGTALQWHSMPPTGGGGGGADEVWLGPDTPTATTAELWLDTDAPSPGGGTGGGLTLTDVSYRHIQVTASTTWTINHGLGFYPNVSAVDSAGHVVIPGTVAYTSATQVVLTFSAAVGGEAYVS